MPDDVPGEGFQVGAAFVSVNAEGEDFQPQVEAIVHESDIVVTVPVVPDGAGFRDKLEGEISAGDMAVNVPIRPDTAGFRMLLQDELAGQAPVTVPIVPDVAGFREALAAELADASKPVEVPLVPDDAGLAAGAETAGETAGKEAAAGFREGFAGTQGALFAEDEVQAGPAGRVAGERFGEEFAASADAAAAVGAAAMREKFASVAGQMPLFPAQEAEKEAEQAGEVAATGFGGRFRSMLGGLPLFGGAKTAIEGDAAGAAETAGVGFGERFSGLLGKMQGFSAAIPGLVSKANQAGEEVGSSLMGRLKGVVSGDLPAMEVLIPAAFVAASAVMASKFQGDMERIHTQAGVGQRALKGLSDAVLGLAPKVGEGPDELSAALYHVESAFQSTGITGKKAMDLLRTAAEGARIGGADLVDVQNALDATIKSGVGGVHNYSQAMGALNAIVGSGDMTMQDLADAMGTGLMAVAKSYGQTLPEIGGALATFGDNNIRGAKAATDLRMAMQAIQEPVTTGAAALQHLGLTTSQMGDQMEHHGLISAIQMFVDHLKASKVPVSDWGEYITQIFGKRAGVGIGVLIDQLDNFKSKIPDITRASHDFGNAWADTQKTTSQELHDMEAGFEALMIRIGQGLLPVLGRIFHAVTEALPYIEHFGEAVAHMVSPYVKDFFTGLAAIFHLLFGPLRDVTLAVGAMAAAWIALDLVMAINPFVAIGIALITLVGIIVKYHKQIFDTITRTWDKIVDFFKHITDPIFKPVEKAFNHIKNFITKSWNTWWAKNGKEVKEVWDAIWDKLKEAFDIFWGGLKSDAKTAWGILVAVFKDAETILSEAWRVMWMFLGAYLKSTWDVMMAVIKIAWAAIKLIFKNAWDIITGIFTIALDLVTGHWSKAWNDALTLVTQVWNNISGFFTSVWGTISSLFTQQLNIIESLLSSVWDAITSSLEEAWGDISSWFSSWWNNEVSGWENIASTVEDLFKKAWDTIWGGIKDAWNGIKNWFDTWWGKEVSGWKNIINGVVKLYHDAWNTIQSDAKTVWGDIEKFFGGVWHDLKKGFDDVVAGIKLAWGKLKAIWDDPVKFLVNTVYDDGIANLWNKVAAKIPGIPKMPIVSMARGGKLPGYGGGDTVPALLEPGETVVSKEHSRQLAGAFQAAGVPGYAKGGIPGGGLVSKIGHAIGGGIHKLVDSVETGSITALKDALRAVVKTSATGDLGKMMIGVPETLITDMVKGVIHKIESIVPGSGKFSSATEDQIAGWWTGAGGPGGNIAHIAAAITGAESSFNVHAIQQGQPYATTGWGLWQITPGDSEPSAGVDDQLLNGPANAKAAVLKYRGAGNSFSPWTTYMDGAYKAFMAAGGRIPAGAADMPQSRWYDTGGWLTPGGGAVNATGRPEAVLTPQESQAFVALVRGLLGSAGTFGSAQAAAAGGGMKAEFNYFGTQYPTPEQRQAMMMDLAAAIGRAG